MTHIYYVVFLFRVFCFCVIFDDFLFISPIFLVTLRLFQVKMPKRPKKKAMETSPGSPHQGAEMEVEGAHASEVRTSCPKVRLI